MKKAKPEIDDWLRTEYDRSDFTELVKGKYANRLKKSTNVVVLEPAVAKVFPNDEAVNSALRELMRKNESSAKSRSKTKSKVMEKRRVA